MANKITARHTAGLNLYALVRSGAQPWNGSAFEDQLAANWGNYDLPMTERTVTGGLSVYSVDFPAGITATGTYIVEVYVRSGGSPAPGDQMLGDPGSLLIVAGKTEPEALRIIGAAAAGEVSGAGTGTEVFADFAGTNCVTVTVLPSGNRTTVVYA